MKGNKEARDAVIGRIVLLARLDRLTVNTVVNLDVI